ncbi:MAG: DUF4430 domain-containing protein [Candidatus Doudnabacteria bacterium]|nr:DUF4430 domain-containing protein [Candidatus Doudnabacteria bacterium]
MKKYFVIGLSILLLAAGCAPQGPARPPEGEDTRGPETQTVEVSQQSAPQSAKPTLKGGDPYETPPYVPDTRQPGPPPEAPQSELPAQTAEYVSYRGQEGKNALDLLKASHKVDVKTYSGIGEFVDGIDGLKSDAQHFWSFYVNGKQATVGAGSYTTKATDVIEWKFERIK